MIPRTKCLFATTCILLSISFSVFAQDYRSHVFPNATFDRIYEFGMGNQTDDRGVNIFENSNHALWIAGYRRQSTTQIDVPATPYLAQINPISGDLENLINIQLDHEVREIPGMKRNNAGEYIFLGWSLFTDDARLFKVSPTGTLLWSTITLDVVGIDIAPTADGGVLLAGAKPDAQNNWQSYVARFSANGTLLWEETFTELNAAQINFAVELTNGDFILTGQGIAPGSTLSYEPFLIKIDAMGNPIWFHRDYIQNPGIDFASAVIAVPNGFVVVGATIRFGPYEQDAYMFKTDTDGQLLWLKEYGHPGVDEQFYKVARKGDGSLVGMGYSDTFSGELYLVGTDADGNQQFERVIELAPNTNLNPWNLTPARNGGLLIVGQFRNSQSGTCGSACDTFLLRTGPTGKF